MKRIRIIAALTAVVMITCCSCKNSDKITISDPDIPFAIEYNEDDTNYLGGYGDFESISSGNSQILFEDDCYLYFCGLRLNKIGSDEFLPICTDTKCKHDAESENCLSYDTINRTIVCGGECYYTDGALLYSVNTKNGSKKLLHDFTDEIDIDSIGALYEIPDSDIIIISTIGMQSVLYDTKKDTATVYIDAYISPFSFDIADGYIYYADSGHFLSRINYNSGEIQSKLMDEKLNLLTSICIYEDRIYFTDSQSYLCSCDMNGNDKKTLPYKAGEVMRCGDKLVGRLYDEKEYLGLCLFDSECKEQEVISTEEFTQPLYLSGDLVYTMQIEGDIDDEGFMTNITQMLCVIDLKNKKHYYYPWSLDYLN